MGVSTNQFQEQVAAEAGGYSAPVFLPRRARDVAVRALPGTNGSATVYFTLDDAQSVEDDPSSATWDAWDEGAVTVNTMRALAGRVTALRLGATTANATMQVVAAVDID